MLLHATDMYTGQGALSGMLCPSRGQLQDTAISMSWAAAWLGVQIRPAHGPGGMGVWERWSVRGNLPQHLPPIAPALPQAAAQLGGSRQRHHSCREPSCFLVGLCTEARFPGIDCGTEGRQRSKGSSPCHSLRMHRKLHSLGCSDDVACQAEVSVGAVLACTTHGNMVKGSQHHTATGQRND